MTLDLGRVVGVHPEDNSVDIVLVSNGARIPGVQVLSPVASTVSGYTNLNTPAAGGEYWDNLQPRQSDTFAAVGFFAGRPIVVGFLFPQVAEVLFKRPNFRVDRHASDWYQTIDDDGNVEWHHPSGSYLRIAEDPEHENLDGQDFDKKWALKRNRQRQPWISVLLRNVENAEVMRLRADPDGNIHLKHTRDLLVETGQHATVTIGGNAQVTVGGNAAIDVAGTTDVQSGGAMHIQAPTLVIDAVTTINGETTVNGQTAINGNTAIAGSLRNNGTNVGSSHTHGGVRGGPDRSSTPG